MKKISELDKSIERVLTSIAAFGIINQEDLISMIDSKDYNGFIRQLKNREYINVNKIRGLKLMTLTNKGYDKVAKFNNKLQEAYEENIKGTNGELTKVSVSRTARARLAMQEAGVDSTISSSIQNFRDKKVFIDGYRVKQFLSNAEDINKAKLNGICLTKSEVFYTYSSEGGFSKVDEVEETIKKRIANTLLPEELRNPKNHYEIVIAPKIENIKNLMYGRISIGINTTNYIVEVCDKNKFFVPMTNAGFQLDYITDREKRIDTDLERNRINYCLRDEISKKLNLDIKELRSSEFTTFKSADNKIKGMIANLLDLNMGMIKQARELMEDGMNVAVIVLSDYKDFFNDFFTTADGKKALVVTVTKEQVYEYAKKE